MAGGAGLALSRSCACLPSQGRRSSSGYAEHGKGTCSLSGRLPAVGLSLGSSGTFGASAPGASASHSSNFASSGFNLSTSNSSNSLPTGGKGGDWQSNNGKAAADVAFAEALKLAVLKLDELGLGLGKEGSRLGGGTAISAPVEQQWRRAIQACQGRDGGVLDHVGPLLNLLIGKACEAMLLGLEESDEQLAGLVPPPSAALAKLRNRFSEGAIRPNNAKVAAQATTSKCRQSARGDGTGNAKGTSVDDSSESANSGSVLGALTLVTPLVAVLDRLKWLHQLVLTQEAEGRGPSSRARNQSMVVVPNSTPELMVTAPSRRSESKGSMTKTRIAATQTTEVSQKSEGTQVQSTMPSCNSGTQTDDVKDEKQQEANPPTLIEAGTHACPSTSECSVQVGASTSTSSSQTLTSALSDKAAQTGLDFRERWLQNASCQTEPSPTTTMASNKQQNQTVRILRIARMERRSPSGKSSESLPPSTKDKSSNNNNYNDNNTNNSTSSNNNSNTNTSNSNSAAHGAGTQECASGAKAQAGNDRDHPSVSFTAATMDSESRQAAGSLRCPRGHGLQWIRRVESAGRDTALNCSECTGPAGEKIGLHSCALCYSGTGERYILCHSCSRKRHDDELKSSHPPGTTAAEPTTSQLPQTRHLSASLTKEESGNAPQLSESGRPYRADERLRSEASSSIVKSASAGSLRAPISNPVLRQRKDASFSRGREWSLVSAGGSAASIPSSVSKQAEVLAAELAPSGL